MQSTAKTALGYWKPYTDVWQMEDKDIKKKLKQDNTAWKTNIKPTKKKKNSGQHCHTIVME